MEVEARETGLAATASGRFIHSSCMPPVKWARPYAWFDVRTVLLIPIYIRALRAHLLIGDEILKREDPRRAVSFWPVAGP